MEAASIFETYLIPFKIREPLIVTVLLGINNPSFSATAKVAIATKPFGAVTVNSPVDSRSDKEDKFQFRIKHDSKLPYRCIHLPLGSGEAGRCRGRLSS